MTETQEKYLQRLLIERRRRLVCAYKANDGLYYAVSRPAGQRTAKYDQRHLLDLSCPGVVRIVETANND